MLTEVFIGKTVDDAVQNGLDKLGIGRDKVTIKVLDEGSRGMFGLFAKMARVEITVNSDVVQPEPLQTEKEFSAPEIDPGSSDSEQSLQEQKSVLESGPLTEFSQRAGSFLMNTTKLMGVTNPKIFFESDDYGLRVRMDGDHIGTLIGHRGETLDALQLLTGLVVNRHQGESENGYCRVALDIGGYRSKREETLRALALRLASKVRRNNRSITLEPLNSYERRIIHSTLHDYEGVTTYSEGDDPYRYVVIAPKK